MQFVTSGWLLLSLWSMCEGATVSPTRVEIGQPTDFTFEVENPYKLRGQFDITARIVSENGRYVETRTLMKFNTPDCTAVGDVTVVVCDVIRMRFKIIARNLKNVNSISGMDAGAYNIAFKRPTGVEIISNAAQLLDNVTLNEGDRFGMRCRLVGGWNHRATFRWFYAATETSASLNASVPDNYHEVISHKWNSFRHSCRYTHTCNTLFGIQVQDRGDYYCEVTYKPPSAGKFRSQTVHIHVPGELPTEAPTEPPTEPSTDNLPPWIFYTIGGTLALILVIIVAASVIIWYKCCRGQTVGGGDKPQVSGRVNSVTPQAEVPDAQRGRGRAPGRLGRRPLRDSSFVINEIV